MNEQMKLLADEYMITDLNKVEKIMNAKAPMNLVYEWVKTGVLNLSSFRNCSRLAMDVEAWRA